MNSDNEQNDAMQVDESTRNLDQGHKEKLDQIQETIRKLKNSVESLEIELNSYRDPDTGKIPLIRRPEEYGLKTERMEGLMLDLENRQKVFKALKLESDMQAEDERKAKERMTYAIQQKQKVIQGYMNSCPDNCKYEDGVTNDVAFIDSFIEWIAEYLPSKTLRVEYLIPVLDQCIKNSSKRTAFIKSLHGKEKARSTFNELKKEFLSYFLGNSWQGTQWSQLMNIAMGKKKPSDYIARLLSACQANGVDVNSRKNPAYLPMLNAWFNRLPHSSQNILKASMKKVLEEGSVQDYFNLIQNDMPQEPGHIKKCDIHCPYCPKLIQWTCDGKTARNTQKMTKRPREEIPKIESEKKTRTDDYQNSRCFSCKGSCDKTKGGCVSKCVKSQTKRKITAGIVIDPIEDRQLNFEQLLETSSVLAIALAHDVVRKRPTCNLVIN